MARILKVIVVEDDTLLCNLFAETLEKDARISTAQAHDLPEAIRLCQQEPQVVLLVDLTIPGAKGVEVIEAGRKAAPGATIVVITGNAEIEKDALSAGATTVIQKGSPESFGDALVKTVRDAVIQHEVQLLYAPMKDAVKTQQSKLNAVQSLLKHNQ